MTSRHTEGKSAYRPDIDGLRAVAVVPVVLYHFGVSGLGGGFVGVDVFFVISGYLIGGLLWAELAKTGHISLSAFYLRRFKRLAPAFFAMAMLSYLAAYIWLLPFEFREFGKSLIAATLYLSNVQFFREAGYFDIGADEKLLLHSWSLAVEEQFYVFLPLVMVALARWRRLLLGGLVLLAVTSLLASLWMTGQSAPAAFFLFPFRAWELLAGVLLAIWVQQRQAGSVIPWKVAPLLSYLGLVLVLGSMVLIEPGGAFPGLQVLAPVLGTLLLILNGEDANAVNRMLRSRAFVFVGLVSYSLYLWHWPVSVLSLYVRGSYANGAEVVGWISLSAVLAVLSWRFVERPVRYRTGLGLRPVLLGVVSASTVALLLGFYAFESNGAPHRFSPEVRSHIAASGDFLQDWSRCETAGTGPLAGVETCVIGPVGPPQVLFWGDSHLRALMEGIAAVANDAGVPGVILWHAGCPPFFDVEKRESAASPAQDVACQQANERIRAALPGLGIRDVVLVGRWSYYAEGAGVGRDAHNQITLLPAGDQAARFATLARGTVSELSQYTRVHLLRQIPEVTQYDSREAARRLAHHRAEGLAESFRVARADLNRRVASSDPVLRSIATDLGAKLLDPLPKLCDDLACSIFVQDQVIYFDNNHVTNAGAYYLAPLFQPVLEAQP